MNDKIKQLAIQAGLIQYDSDGKLQDAEKFALLIVQECLTQIDKMRDGFEADGENKQALGADWVGLAVARHFGVE